MREQELSVLERFLEHAEQWIKETKDISGTEKFFNEHHRKIIEMGDEIVPILLNDMATKLSAEGGPPHWFWALKLITDEDPVPTKERGRIELMAQRWIDWGIANGKIKREDGGDV